MNQIQQAHPYQHTHEAGHAQLSVTCDRQDHNHAPPALWIEERHNAFQYKYQAKSPEELVPHGAASCSQDCIAESKPA